MKHRYTKYKLMTYMCIGAFGFTSCKTKYVQIPIKEKVVETVTQTVHDSTIVTHPDSTWYWAMIECQNGKPAIKQNKDSGKGPVLNPPKVNLDGNGNLTVDCEARAQELFLQWKSQTRERIEEKEVPVYIEKMLTKWEGFQIIMGRIFLGFWAFTLIGYVLKIVYNKFIKK